MEGNADFQGQGENGNDHQKIYHNNKLNLKEGKSDLESCSSGCNSLFSQKCITQNKHEGNKTSDNDLSMQGAEEPHNNASSQESIEIKTKPAYNNVLVELGNQKPDYIGIVTTKPLGNISQNIEQGLDDSCIKRVADDYKTNFNNFVESSSVQHGDMHENPDIPQSDLKKSLNDNERDCSIEDKIYVQDTVNIFRNSEILVADISPEVLVKEVTKLNISKDENKSKGIDSKVIVNRQSESLKSLMVYDGDSDSDERSDTEPQAEVIDLSSEDEENNTNTKKTWRKNTDDASGSSDSESDSSASTLSLESDSDEENSDGDSVSVIDASDDGIRVDSTVVSKNSSDKGAVKKKNPNILDLEEFLPPLPDLSQLNINVDEADFMHMGKISAIISELVTIEALPGTPAFDLDSMLFIEDGTAKKPIGPIFDVLGPVTEPIYCVRFNTEKEVKDLGLKSGLKVYAVPKSEEFTKYVFVQELMKIRGSDASWFHDHETPSELAEFSDDEKERDARRAKKTSMKRKLNDGSLERHKRYERTMNQCNSLNTRVCRLMDAHKNLSKHIRPSAVDDIKPPSGCPELPPIPPPLFDPTVPPPGFGQTPYGISAQPPPFDASRGFGQSATYNNSLSPYNNQTGVPGSPFGPPIMFGHHYANETPSPQSLCPPPARWSWKSQREEFRRPHRSNNPRSNNQQNLENYFTTHGRSTRPAGPSSQPF